LEKQNHAEVTETGMEKAARQPEFVSRAGRESGRVRAGGEQTRLLLVLLLLGFLALLTLTSTVMAPSNSAQSSSPSNWYNPERKIK